MLNQFKLTELKSNGEKQYFIEGLVSTIRPDDYNDIVTSKAQNSIDEQLKRFNITMDLEHEEWIDISTGKRHERKQNKIPVALVEKSSVTDDGTFVRAKLNSSHPKFKNILKSIKDGFLHSFSIAYDVTKKRIETIGDQTFRIIDDLVISNIGITGNPVNKEATFRVALKSMSIQMVEENKITELETQFAELKSANEKLSTDFAELKSMDYKAMYEELKADNAELKSRMDKMKAKETDEETEEDKKKKEKEVKSKSELETVKKELAEIKSTLEKVRNTPIAGAELKSKNETPNELAEINFVGLNCGGNM